MLWLCKYDTIFNIRKTQEPGIGEDAYSGPWGELWSIPGNWYSYYSYFVHSDDAHALISVMYLNHL